MKLSKKKQDAIIVMVWGIATMATLVLFFFTQEITEGFLMLFCTIWFLNEDHEYKQKYPEEEKENNKEG